MATVTQSGGPGNGANSGAPLIQARIATAARSAPVALGVVQMPAQLATIAALVGCWRRSLPEDVVPVGDTALTWQVSMRAICELLAQAEALYAEWHHVEDGGADGPPPFPVMYAHWIAETLEGAMWQLVDAGPATKPMPVSDCVSIAAQIEQYVAEAIRWCSSPREGGAA